MSFAFFFWDRALLIAHGKKRVSFFIITYHLGDYGVCWPFHFTPGKAVIFFSRWDAGVLICGWASPL